MIQIQLKKNFPFIDIWKSLGKPVKGESYSRIRLSSNKDNLITNCFGENNTGSAKSITILSGGLDLSMNKLTFFRKNLWVELDRFNSKGNFVNSVTCTPENYINLYNSQFTRKTIYGEVFTYKLSE